MTTKKEEKKHRAVYVRLPFDVWEKLAHMAVDKLVSVNALIIEAIKEKLK